MKITTKKTPKYTVNVIHTDKFKTNRITLTFVGELEEKTVTARALLPYLLKAISTTYPTRAKMSTALEEMYAAQFHVSVGKIGLAHAISFDLSIVQDEYLLEKETLFEKGFAFLHEVLYHPRFSEHIFQEEKRLLQEYFLGMYANKMKYAAKQLHEIMFEKETNRFYALG